MWGKLIKKRPSLGGDTEPWVGGGGKLERKERLMMAAVVGRRMVLSRVMCGGGSGTIMHKSVMCRVLVCRKIDTMRGYAIAAGVRGRTTAAAPFKRTATTTTATTTRKKSAAKPRKRAKKAAPKKKKKRAVAKKKKKPVKVARIKLPVTRLSSWLVFLQEHPYNGAQYSNIQDYIRAMARQYKLLNTQQIQVLKDSAVRQNERNGRERDSILRTLSPEQIQQENQARYRLRKRGHHVSNLANPDRPRRPVNAWVLFSLSRSQQSGVKGVDGFRQGAPAWRAASANEKRPFEEQAAQLKEQYKRQLADFEAKQNV